MPPLKPMKILHTVQSYSPAEGGMAEVARQLSERLVALGHFVTVATESHGARDAGAVNGVEIVSFDVRGNAAKGYQGDTEAYRRFLLDSRFDVVTSFAAQQWATDLALPLLPRIHGRKVLVPTGFSGLFSRSYRDYFGRMPEWMRQYDMNVFLSDDYRDIRFARSHGIRNTTVIPNGAAADEFLASAGDIRAQLGVPEDHFLVLHVGSHTWLKGHEEAMEIFRLAQISDATLLVVGNEPAGGCAAACHERAQRLNGAPEFTRAGKRIVVTPLSRAQTVAAYHAADLFLFPSNIECSPIVLFECMASRTPFLVTDVGNSAEIAAWSGGAGMVLPSRWPSFLPRYGSFPERVRQKARIVLGRADDFRGVRPRLRPSAALLAALYHDPRRRAQMAGSGFAAWQERYTWERIAVQYENLYRNLLEGST